jgi:hypothetical protein
MRTAIPSARWWWALVALPPLMAVVSNVVAPKPHGHWLEHLGSANLKATQLVLLIVVAAVLGWRKIGGLLLLCLLGASVGIVLQSLGDYQVAKSIWRTPGNPGFGDGYEAGHSLSGTGDLIVAIFGLAFAVVAGVTRRVSVPLAIGAGGLAIIPPPFFWPALGILVMMLVWLQQRNDRLPATITKPPGGQHPSPTP